MTLLQRWLKVTLVVGVSMTAAACGRTSVSPTPEGTRPAGETPATPVEIGAELFSPAELPKITAAPAQPEPVVIQQATISFDTKVQLAAEVDGIVEIVGSPLPAGTKIDPGDSTILPHPRRNDLLHRKLRENSPITVGQVLARLDESQVSIQLQGLKDTVAAFKIAKAKSEIVVAEAKKVTDAYSRAGGSSSSIEAANAVAQYAKAEEGLARAISELARYEAEVSVTEKKLDQYWIKSTVEGRISRIFKNPGEFAKAGETILEVQGTARFRVEGNVDVQDVSRLQLNMPVVVEPTRPLGPEPYPARHRQAVASVCVTAHKGRPLVVSGGMDSVALVWDVTKTRRQHALGHPAGQGVKAVATTSAKAATSLAATGTTAGRIRIWDLSNPDALPNQPLAEFEEAHSGSVTSLSFSPDGAYLASAAGRDVFLWDVAARKKLYSLPVEHKDDITSIQFTPQCTLVSVARDKSIKIWKIGQQGARAEKTLDHRFGSVDVLGLSADGGRVLFDQTPGRLDMVNLEDSRTVGSLFNTGGSLRFSGLALISPDDNLILTGSSDADSKGELQLWDKPAINGRGSESRRLVTPGRMAVTCAAFSPDPQHRFVVVGTDLGSLHYWMTPSPGEMNKSWKGKIVSITKTDSRTATVRVEVDNPGGRMAEWLQDRGTATIIIDPTAQPEPTAQAPEPTPMIPMPPRVIVPAGLVQPAPVLPKR
jgi:WD40 repeat protein